MQRKKKVQVNFNKNVHHYRWTRVCALFISLLMNE